MIRNVGQRTLQGVGKPTGINHRNELPGVRVVVALPIRLIFKNRSGRLPAVVLGEGQDRTPPEDIEAEISTLALKIHAHCFDSQVMVASAAFVRPLLLLGSASWARADRGWLSRAESSNDLTQGQCIQSRSGGERLRDGS